MPDAPPQLGRGEEVEGAEGGSGGVHRHQQQPPALTFAAASPDESHRKSEGPDRRGDEGGGLPDRQGRQSRGDKGPDGWRYAQ